MATRKKSSDGSMISSLDTFLKEGPGKRFIEPRILFLLSQRPTHGYGLISRMEEVPLPGPLPDTGAVYRKLRQMEGKDLISSRWEDPGPGPQRRVYSITTQGRKRLAMWIEAIRIRVDMLQQFVMLCDNEKAS